MEKKTASVKVILVQKSSLLMHKTIFQFSVDTLSQLNTITIT